MAAVSNDRQNFPDQALYTLDNLEVLRGMNSETVDLIATDPPFNTSRNRVGSAGFYGDKWKWGDTGLLPDQWKWNAGRFKFLDIPGQKLLTSDNLPLKVITDLWNIISITEVLATEGCPMVATRVEAPNINLVAPVSAPTQCLDTVLNRVNLADCLDLMAQLPAGCAQMVFADPPFNLDKKYESYKDKLPLAEYLDWTREWLTEASRILTPGGSLFLYNIPKLLTYSAAILNELLDFRHWIAWNSGGKPLGKTLQPAHYGILFYTKGGRENTKFYDVRAPHKQCRECQAYAKDYGGKEYMRHPFGVQISDVWDDIHRVRHASKRIADHPCQLPVHLVERLILMSTDPGDIVVDPFCGGGAAAVAAKQLGRQYLGAEIDPQYQRAAQAKLEQARAVTIGRAYVSMHLGKIVSIRDRDIKEEHIAIRKPAR